MAQGVLALQVELGMEYGNEEEYGEEGIREVKGIRVRERDREIGE
jgi:hypothetical protein